MTPQKKRKSTIYFDHNGKKHYVRAKRITLSPENIRYILSYLGRYERQAPMWDKSRSDLREFMKNLRRQSE